MKFKQILDLILCLQVLMLILSQAAELPAFILLVTLLTKYFTLCGIHTFTMCEFHTLCPEEATKSYIPSCIHTSF